MLDSHVFAKLDWFSVVLYNTCMDDILKKLCIYNEVYEELLGSAYIRSQGFSDVVVFTANGVSIELRHDDYLSTDKESVFAKKFKKIRVDISGSGLDFLRGYFRPDVEFLRDDFWGVNQEDYNITRCDFAYDFVNYKPEFLDHLLNWIKDFERDLISDIHSGADIRLNAGSRHIQYSYRCGSGQKTLYLGSPRGDKMVRIYDKYLEQTKNGIFIHGRDPRFEGIPQIDSWFRIELQCRRKCATQYLFGCHGNIDNVLRAIFDDYLIRDKDGNPLPCMVDLYKWDDLPPIEKVEFYTVRETVLERSIRRVKDSI